MKSSASRQFVTFLLVVGAVAFGMVLAGGLGLTVPGMADDEVLGPQVVARSGSANGVPSFADLAEAVEPAVVSIRADTYQTGSRRQVNPFEFFFGPRRRPGAPEQETPEEERFRSESGGSGFLISADGLIVTNNHVIEGADRLMVTLGDREYPAELKGTDPATDIALLKIDAGSNLRHLRLGDSERLRVGDWVMAIGSPLNLDHTVTVGVVSAKGRSIGIIESSFENFIQTDAAINFGNSGGPLVNLDGEVVGVATAINFGAENIGFAVPVSTVKQVLPQLRDEGRVTRGYLGVDIKNLDFDEAEAFGLDSTDGALVLGTRGGDPAAEAGIRHGDVILQVDDIAVEDTRDLIDYVATRKPGEEVRLTIWRNGERLVRTAELGERPGLTQQAAIEEEGGSSGIDWLGIRYQELSEEIRQAHGLPSSATGVWVTDVEPDSPLYDEQVRPRDIISEVNGHPVESAREFESAVEATDSGRYLRLYVQRYDPQGERWISFFAPVRKP